ncbi:sigma-70 family RNA polymerase sigma factor [Sphingobacterium sp.]|uniref:RNA polymerase sigma factor n=1 Tax=Sphingobacterium sp. TaxID=341027 RepID=UPI00289639B9|nr:sigma-70 family RNA polymerase sigma factor [Sphingobacterium sp.]
MAKVVPIYGEVDLVKRLKQGDYGAFDQLYHQFAHVSLVKLKKLVHVHDIAVELHQDLFMKIWEKRADIPHDIPFKAILFQTLKSIAYNFYRKAAQDKNLHERLIAASTELHNQLEDQLNFNETNELLAAAIAKLPAQRQKIFTRIKIDGKSYEEVAAEFGISLSTVKDHMTRSFKFLRNELSDQYLLSVFLVLASNLLDQVKA